MKTQIIAEAGVNHNGKMSLAKKMISEAAKFGADYVKFQAYDVNELLLRNTKKAKYQKNTSGKNETQYAMLKKLQLKEKDFIILKNFCKKKKIKFLLSFFDTKSLQLIKKLNLNELKIPSGEINNYLLMKEIGKLKKKVILSSGISSLKEIRQAIIILKKNGTKLNNITVLHCNSEYPTKLKDVNMNAIKTINRLCKVNVGYSDHTLGFEASTAAVCLGAKIIEKHFTLNHNYSGPDHKASLIPSEFKNFINQIRKTETLLGSNIKKPSNSELKNKSFIRKSIVAKKSIDIGDRFSLSNLTTMRPGVGMSPVKLPKLLNKKSKKKYEAGDFI